MLSDLCSWQRLFNQVAAKERAVLFYFCVRLEIYLCHHLVQRLMIVFFYCQTLQLQLFLLTTMTTRVDAPILHEALLYFLFCSFVWDNNGLGCTDKSIRYRYQYL